MHTGYSKEEIKHFVKEHNLLKDSSLFNDNVLEQLYDLDKDDWNNVIKRQLFSPYIFENYYKLLITPEQRVDTIYVLSKLEEVYWQNIFNRALYHLIGLKVFLASDLMLLAKLTDREFERADSLGIFDYDNKLMEDLSCKDLYLLAKYPEPLLEEAVKRNIYNTPNEYKKLLADKKLFPSASCYKSAFELTNSNLSEVKQYNSKIQKDILYLKSTQLFLPQSILKQQGFCIEKIQNSGYCENIFFFAHGLADEQSLNNFLKLEQNSVIRASYVNLKKGNTKLFYKQGVILKVKHENIHAGYYKDMQTFEYIDIDTLIFKYLFNDENKIYRTYFSSIFKEVFCFDNDSYIDFIEKYKNRHIEEIEDNCIKDKILKYLDSIPVKFYEKDHNHNEILITNPKISALFVCDTTTFDIPDFLINFAKQQNLPVYILD